MNSVAERFQDVVEQYGDSMWRLTWGYAEGLADREDLHQDIMVAIWRALPTFRAESSLRTFVFRIGHNRGLTHRARAQRRRVDALDEVSDIADPTADPSADAVAVQRVERLSAAIRKLPTSLGQPVMLSLEGLSHREIGHVMGITENNAAVRLNRARSSLRDLLSPHFERE